MNIFSLLDSLLADYLDPKARRAVHTILLIASAVVAIWLAADHDWKQFALALAAAIYSGANRANTDPDAPPIDADEPEAVGTVSGNPEVGPDEDEYEDASAFYGDGAERGDVSGY